MEVHMFADPTFQTRATPRRAAALLESLSSMISQAVLALAREWRIRRDLGQLAQFDDAMLHDIGLARSEIEPALRHGRSFRDTQSSSARERFTAS